MNASIRSVGLRFAFCYLVLYNNVSFLWGWPLVGALADGYQRGWQALVGLMAERVLRWPGGAAPSSEGSGDTSYHYAEVASVALLATALTFAWSLGARRRAPEAAAGAERRHAREEALWAWLRVYVRYVLAFAMVSYGAVKVFKRQFPDLGAEQLTRTYGESSPMALLWIFMGYSRPYNVFTGLAEVVGGVLLFGRRTATLGALLTVAVMANVAALNFCYDVPVKLYSSHLLLMALFLLAPDARRLGDFALGRPAAGAAAAAPLSGWARRVALPLKALLIGGLAVDVVTSEREARATSREGAEDSPARALRGRYRVEGFAGGGAEGARWRGLLVGRGGALSVRREDDELRVYVPTIDPAAHTMTLARPPAAGRPANPAAGRLRYEQPDPDHLRLEGDVDGEPLRVQLVRLPEAAFPLLERGFHWVNEYPYHR
jgi:hypothetical protein